jgi:hypothetical protein
VKNKVLLEIGVQALGYGTGQAGAFNAQTVVGGQIHRKMKGDMYF